MSEHETSESGRAVVYALRVNLVVVTVKSVVGAVTLSPAMLAEAAHSAVDCTTQVCLWVGNRRGGRARYGWALLAAAVMFVSGGLWSLWHGVSALLASDVLEGHRLSVWVSVAVLLAASCGEATSLVTALRALASTRGELSWWRHLRTTTDTDAKAIVWEDGSDILGNLVALVGIALTAITGWVGFDAIAALVVGALLTLLSVELGAHNVRLFRLPTRPVLAGAVA